MLTARLRRLPVLLEITRPDNSVQGALYALLGAYLSADLVQAVSPPALGAALVVALVVAYGFTINDVCDAPADSLVKPTRPIPSGRLTRADAHRFALTLAALALATGALLGPWLFLLALANILLTTAYSVYLKPTLLLGNLTMALLDATIILYGSLAVGRIAPAVWVVSALTFLYILGQEILYTVEDREADALGGLRTTAVRLGHGAALRLFRLLALLFALTAILPWLVGIATPRYLAAILVCTILPTLGVVAVLTVRPTPTTIHRSLRLMKLVWFSSLLPVVLLK